MKERTVVIMKVTQVSGKFRGRERKTEEKQKKRKIETREIERNGRKEDTKRKVVP